MEISEELFRTRSIPKIILSYAVPTVLSQLVTLLYNLADTFFVGHTNDPAQVAALTLSFPLFMLMTMVGNLFGIGANSLISRSLGSGDREMARKTSTFAFYGALAAMGVIIAVLAVFLSPILRLVGARTEAVFEATRAYLTWTVLLGGLPTVAQLLLAHITRGEGNTRQASLGMALGGVLNIFLDPVFVQGLGMGAAGAGIATAISNTVALGYFLIRARRDKHSVTVLDPRKLTVSGDLVRQVILVGLPAAAVIVLGSSSNMVLNHFMSAYGDVSVAAYGIVQKIGTITIQITIGLTQGLMPLLGYCYGAGALDRVRQIDRWAFAILAVYAAVCVVLIEVFARTLIAAFIGDSETISIGVGFLRKWILCAGGMCFTMLFNSIFQSMGKWVQSLMLTCIRQGFVLIPLLFVMDHFFGPKGLILCNPIADTCALAVGIVLYLRTMKKLRQTQSV